MELTDKQVVEEVMLRLDEKNRALSDLKNLTRNLELVNRKLQDSEKLKSSFISNLKNEINNPLTSLVTLSGELESLELKDEEKYKTIARMINCEAKNLDFQIRNVLMASEMESGEVPLHMAKVEIVSLVDDHLKNFDHLIAEKGIKVEGVNAEPLWINTDADKLGIIFANLISNAIVFNKDGGRMEISMSVKGDNFIFSASDEGIGIKKADQKFIFDWFKQLDTGFTKRYRGHGLGLSVAKAAAELLEGSLTVESKPGSGSKFKLQMPAHVAEDTQEMFVDGVDFFFEEGQEF